MYSFQIQPGEQMLKKGLASLQAEDATLSGAIYLTDVRLVFVGYLLGGPAIKKELSLPLADILSIAGGKTALIIPNAVDITPAGADPFRLILRDRNAWLSAIRDQMSVHAGN